jgi:hypothetical protein
VALLETDERDALLERISALWEQEPELRGRTSVTLGYLTRVRRCQGVR